MITFLDQNDIEYFLQWYTITTSLYFTDIENNNNFMHITTIRFFHMDTKKILSHPNSFDNFHDDDTKSVCHLVCSTPLTVLGALLHFFHVQTCVKEKSTIFYECTIFIYIFNDFLAAFNFYGWSHNITH